MIALNSKGMTFVNTRPYVSAPIRQYQDFRFVSWESDIYPAFKGQPHKEEIEFFANLIVSNNLHSILDLGLGGGIELDSIMTYLNQKGHILETTEANEVDDIFIKQAKALLTRHKHNVMIHNANWIDLPSAQPPYTHEFDFAYLTGNSLSYIGGGTRRGTKRSQQAILDRFAGLIRRNGYFFIDTRNFDFIKSLMDQPSEEIIRRFTFQKSVYYHGTPSPVRVVPAYISDTVVVMHYYIPSLRIWSKLDLYPIYHSDLLDILSRSFSIERIFHDFVEVNHTRKMPRKSQFIQYLIRKR